MLPERDLRQALAGVPLIELQGTFHRFVELQYLHATDLLTQTGSFDHGGRFTPPEQFHTLYLACSATTALREAESRFLASGIVEHLAPSRPYVHFGIAGTLQRVLDLTDSDVLVSLSTTEQELEASWELIQARGDEAPTQTLGRVAYLGGRIEAIYSHSTRDKPDGRCVAVFPNRLSSPSWLQIVDDTGQLTQQIP
ncbi:MAG: RES family NAD+ phosphorylase [Candidatus Methylomirabilales bacterium]